MCLTFFGFVLSGFGIVYSLRVDVRTITGRLLSVESELKKMGDVLVQLGRQDERLSAMDKRIDDLQHGRGFVLDALPRSMKSGRD